MPLPLSGSPHQLSLGGVSRGSFWSRGGRGRK